MNDIAIQFCRDTASLPKRATVGSAGYDITAALDETAVCAPGERILIPTGFKIALPLHIEAQIRPRSGLAYKQGLTVLNSPGTIDSDFRGEVHVLLANLGDKPIEIEPGMRIAQMVFNRVEHPAIVTVSSLQDTERGEGGFGHSGV